MHETLLRTNWRLSKSDRKTKLLWLQKVKRNENLHLPPESQIRRLQCLQRHSIQDENLRPQEKGKELQNGFCKTRHKQKDCNKEAILKEDGLNCDTLKIKSKNDKEKGWDWIVIEVGFANEQFYSRIYSGFKGGKSGMENIAAGSSNIEKAIGGSN